MSSIFAYCCYRWDFQQSGQLRCSPLTGACLCVRGGLLQRRKMLGLSKTAYHVLRSLHMCPAHLQT